MVHEANLMRAASLPRLLWEPFEHIPDAARMREEFPTWPDRDHNAAFRKVGLCGVVGLLADPLMVYAHGACPTFPHDAAGKTAAEVAAEIAACDHGNWDIVNGLKVGTLALLFLFPLTGAVGRPGPGTPTTTKQATVQYGSTNHAAGGGMPQRTRSAGKGPRYEMVHIQQGP